MTDFDRNRQRIFLYTHSPEADQAIDSGKATISAGGIRRPDGTMMDMAKPLSFTLGDLKKMVSEDKPEIGIDTQLEHIENELHLSQEGMQELIRIGWLNNSSLNHLYSMTYTGFQQTLSGIKNLSSNMNEFRQYVELQKLNDINEKTEEYISYLGNDMQRLRLQSTQLMNTNIDEHLSKIGSFIKRMYDGMLNGAEDGWLSCVVIKALVGPFSDVLKKYASLFYYEYGELPDCYKWAKLVYELSSNPHFKEKLRYYIQLETELPYRDKVAMEKDYIRKAEDVYNALMFDVEYALYHSKEDYLEMNKTINRIISSPQSIPEDGNIYL